MLKIIRFLNKPRLLIRKISSYFLKEVVLNLIRTISKKEVPKFLFIFTNYSDFPKSYKNNQDE